MRGLTDFQVEVTRLFFSLPASDGFLLAGEGALLASGLTTRPAQDLHYSGELPDNLRSLHSPASTTDGSGFARRSSSTGPGSL